MGRLAAREDRGIPRIERTKAGRLRSRREGGPPFVFVRFFAHLKRDAVASPSGG